MRGTFSDHLLMDSIHRFRAVELPGNGICLEMASAWQWKGYGSDDLSTSWLVFSEPAVMQYINKAGFT